MRIKVDNVIAYSLQPLFKGIKIVIGIDSSKSNTAIAVGDEGLELLHYIEFDGTQDGTTEEDTLKLCQAHREAMKELFMGAHVMLVGIEDIITKAEKGKDTGMTVHKSRFKITAVFMSIICFFQDNFQMTPQLIPNQSWKAAILPERFRKRDIGKGSLAYMKSINSVLAGCSDDVTDAYCIMLYLGKINKVDIGERVKGVELSLHKHVAVLVSGGTKLEARAKVFLYNNKLSLEQNADVMCNKAHIAGLEVSVAEVCVDYLTFDEIYRNCRGTFRSREEVLKLVVVEEK